jgi:hypothetical protein
MFSTLDKEAKDREKKREISKEIVREDISPEFIRHCCQHKIPERILTFFCEHKDLHPQQLFLKNPGSGIKTIFELDWIRMYTNEIFNLIKFYYETPGLSVDTLITYTGCPMRDLAVHDKDFLFHKWLLEHELTLPEGLVKSDGRGPARIYQNSDNIRILCNESGIAYLTRVILTHPKSEWQKELNKLADSGQDLFKEKVKVLADFFPDIHTDNSDHDSWINRRYRQYVIHEEENVAKVYSSGCTSLLWMAAKKLSKTLTEEERLNELPEDIRKIIKSAQPF